MELSDDILFMKYDRKWIQQGNVAKHQKLYKSSSKCQKFKSELIQTRFTEYVHKFEYCAYEFVHILMEL